MYAWFPCSRPGARGGTGGAGVSEERAVYEAGPSWQSGCTDSRHIFYIRTAASDPLDLSEPWNTELAGALCQCGKFRHSGESASPLEAPPC